VSANEAHGATSIVDLDGIAVGGDAVIEDKGGHSLGVEPGGKLEAFVANGDVFVSSAGYDKDGGAGGACLGQEGVHAGLVGFTVAECAGRSVEVEPAFVEVDGWWNGGSGLGVEKLCERKSEQ
jgi:hypothetical protein